MILKKVEGKLVTEGMRPTLFVPMTGLAEQSRKIQPDPSRPTLFNGDFEETLEGHDDTPVGWFFLRQMTVVTAADAPSGQRYAAFKNLEPGDSARAMQGMAVDGRQVKQLKVTLHVRAENIRPGPSPSDAAMLLIGYYDENRADAGPPSVMGLWRGTFDWQTQCADSTCPPAPRGDRPHRTVRRAPVGSGWTTSRSKASRGKATKASERSHGPRGRGL